MSTINRMLTSLEARAATPGAPALSGEVRALRAARQRHRRHALLGAVLVAAAAAVVWDRMNLPPGQPVEAGVEVASGSVRALNLADATPPPPEADVVQPGPPVDLPPVEQRAGKPRPDAEPTGATRQATDEQPPQARPHAPQAAVPTAAGPAGPTRAATDTLRSRRVEPPDPQGAPAAKPPASTGGERRRTDEAASVLARRGADALASGHVRLAASWLREALMHDDAQVQAHLDLATALLHLRDADGALTHARRAAALLGDASKASPQARRVLAMAHAQRREWDLVLQAADAAHAAGDMVLLALRAAAYVQQRRWHDALGAYEGLLAAAPREARWWLGLATAQRALGNRDGARDALHMAAAQARDETVLAAVHAQLAALASSPARDAAADSAPQAAPALAAIAQPADGPGGAPNEVRSRIGASQGAEGVR